MNGQLSNITSEPPYPDALLRVYIFGLGTLWFDAVSNRAEFGLIDVPSPLHPLTIEICENGQIIFSEEVAADKTIFISGSPTNLGMGDQYHSADHPQPDDPNKPDNDFRWMIDLDSVYNPPLDIVAKPDFFARLNIAVGDAIFFTEHKSEGNAYFEDLSGQPVSDPAPVGQVIGLSSQKNASEVRIDNGPNLLPDPDGTYSVIIRYHCSAQTSATPENSDFSEIYNVIVDAGSLQKYNLVYELQQTPWISACEMEQMKAYSDNVAAIFNQNPTLSQEQMTEVTAQLSYINHLLSCEMACQDVIFGKYSRTVSS